MNRADTIRNMTDEQLAQFLKYQENLGLPDISFRCWFYCPDYKNGCFHKCVKNQGDEYRAQWLKEECGDYSGMLESTQHSYHMKEMSDVLAVSEPEPLPASTFATQFFRKTKGGTES